MGTKSMWARQLVGPEIFAEVDAAAPDASSLAPGEVLIDGKPVDPKARHVIEPGSKILLKTPGGGGYGERSVRSPELIACDRAAGYVS